MLFVPYFNVVDSIIYAMVCNRLNISKAVSVASRYIANLGKVHWQTVKLILHYLKGTLNVGLVFDRGSNITSNIISHV